MAVRLFGQPTRIGYRCQWEQLVREKGYRIVGHQLVPIGNDESVEPATGEESVPLEENRDGPRFLFRGLRSKGSPEDRVPPPDLGAVWGTEGDHFGRYQHPLGEIGQ